MTAALGRVGLWAPLNLWTQEGNRLPLSAAEIERLGFGAIWLGNGPTLFDVCEALLEATAGVTVATGIANIWAHPAAVVAARRAAIVERHPSRLLLGLGNGPREPGQWRMSPYRTLQRYLDELDLLAVPVAERLLAATGPRLLALAGARTLGAHPFLTTAEHTYQARAALGDRPLLAPEMKVVLEADPAKARAIARQALEFYLSKRGFSGNLMRLGFTEQDLAGGGSDHLVDAVVAWGDTDTVVRRIREHHDAGADHVAVQVLTPTTDAPDPSRRRLPLQEYQLLGEALAGG
ncbi:TIGR03620 family F420-dependent LLM class oxidoreductase [Micromonosporaceae bacterium Da 78-11]